MKPIAKILLCLFVYLLLGLILAALSHRCGRLFFVWNVFLAFLPLLFSRLLHLHLSKGKTNKLVIGLWLVLWLLFFPNAPYMVTDLIYFGGTNYFTPEGYTTSMLAWTNLVYLAGGVLFASTLGLFSLYDIHLIFRKRLGGAASFAAVALCSLLGGFGIYLGRILRFNSWDILNPIHMFTRITNELNSFSVKFSLLFALLIFGGYIVFYILIQSLRSHSADASS